MRSEGWQQERFDGPGLPSMISPEEMRYLHWLARCIWRDAGHVVELGPWLGGSTACLAAGMRARGSLPAHRLHSFDDCVWRAFMSERAALPLAPGDSFEPLLRENLAPFAELVCVQRARLPDETVPGDAGAARLRELGPAALAEFAWPAGEPIEILFVDGAKSWRGLRHLLLAVSAALLPGGLLVCQDYKYWGCYWVPMILGRLARHLEPVHDVLGGSTLAFALRGRIPHAELAALAPDVHAADPGQALADLEAGVELLRGAGDRRGSCHVALAEVSFRAHRGEVDAALAAFRRCEAAWPVAAPPLQLERARESLSRLRGAALPERRALRLARRARRLVTRLARAR